MVFIYPHNQFKVASLSERLLLILFQLLWWRSNSLLTGFLLPIFLSIPTPILLMTHLYQLWGFPGGRVVKNLPANAGDARDLGSVSGSGRSPGVGNGNPLQYSCLENSMDREAWRATVHGVAKSQTRLNDYRFLRGWIIIRFLQTRRWRLGAGDLAKVAQLLCARTQRPEPSSQLHMLWSSSNLTPRHFKQDSSGFVLVYFSTSVPLFPPHKLKPYYSRFPEHSELSRDPSLFFHALLTLPVNYLSFKIQIKSPDMKSLP